MVHIAAIKNVLLGKKPLASQAQSSEEHFMFKRRSKWEKSIKLFIFFMEFVFYRELWRDHENVQLQGHRKLQSLADSKQIIKNPWLLAKKKDSKHFYRSKHPTLPKAFTKIN